MCAAFHRASHEEFDPAAETLRALESTRQKHDELEILQTNRAPAVPLHGPGSDPTHVHLRNLLRTMSLPPDRLIALPDKEPQLIFDNLNQASRMLASLQVMRFVNGFCTPCRAIEEPPCLQVTYVLGRRGWAHVTLHLKAVWHILESWRQMQARPELCPSCGLFERFVPLAELTDRGPALDESRFVWFSRCQWRNQPVELIEVGKVSKHEVDDFFRYVTDLTRLDHPNLVAPLGIVSDTPVRVITEASGCELSPEVVQSLRLDSRYQLMWQLCDCLIYLHDQGVSGWTRCQLFWISQTEQLKMVDVAINGGERDEREFDAWVAPSFPENRFAADVFTFGYLLIELFGFSIPWSALTTRERARHLFPGALPPELDAIPDEAMRNIAYHCVRSTPSMHDVREWLRPFKRWVDQNGTV
jgi:hypothetical protein